MLIEAAGLLRFGIHQQTAAADGIAEAGDLGDHIDQHYLVEPLVFMEFFDAQTSHQCDGLGVSAGATAQPLG